MGIKFWAGACFMTCFCFLGSAGAQEPTPTRCAPASNVAVGHHEPGTTADGASPDRARQPGCTETRSAITDADKALGIALLGCAIAFGSHVARRRSTKVVLS